MNIVGSVESLWRYPVKSMRGQEMDELFAGFAGIYGDRVFAFYSSGSRPGFPFLTGREQRQMVRYQPRFRHPDKAAAPINLTEAQNLPPGALAVYADRAEMMIDVETPEGDTMALDDPALVARLREDIDKEHEIKLLYSNRAMADCRPISLLSLQTVRQLSQETDMTIDKRRFRANIYLNLKTDEGFAEEKFIGHSVRIGSKLTLSILQRDPRCMMITIDPDTAEKTPEVLKNVAQAHDGMTGIYGAVLAEGVLRKGDPIELLN